MYDAIVPLILTNMIQMNETLSGVIMGADNALASIALWFFGYNGVTTWFTTYVSNIMGSDIGRFTGSITQRPWLFRRDAGTVRDSDAEY